jgi:hypothetical protein
MAHLGKHWTQTPVLEIKRRMYYLEIELSAKYLIYFKLLIIYVAIYLVWLNKSYQMNPANYREALTEMREDESEGADILLVGLVFLCIRS